MPSPETSVLPQPTYSILGKDGVSLAGGMPEQEARQIAQRTANALGVSLFLRMAGTSDTVEVAPQGPVS